MDWRQIYKERLCTANEAVSRIKSGDRIYVGTGSSIAYKLSDALYERKDELEDVLICHGLTSRIMPFFLPDAKGHFSTISFFSGAGERTGIKNGQTKFTSLHLSQIRKWCHDTARPNVVFLEVSRPDDDGYVSYGAFGTVFHEYARQLADLVVIQVNSNVPYVCGTDTKMHISQADVIVEVDDEITTIPNVPIDDDIYTLSKYIVDLIPDGATLQLGIGGVANAIGFGLKDHNDIGIHTEMLTDSMMELIKSGIVNNSRKTYMKGKTLAAFALGSKELYEFIDHNEDIHFAPFNIVNDPYVIAKNDNMISVNTAMSIDLYGQVVADCLGGRQQSATGGQIDYVRGAQMSKGGKSIIALTSTVTSKGGRGSRIVADFPPGTAITTPRADVQYIATEFGCVNLYPLTMDERARAIISLAHPDFRDELTEHAKERGII